MSGPLSTEQIESALKDLPGWAYTDGALVKSYKFGSFREAMSFLVRVSYEAEQRNHHPEIYNVYSSVRLSLNTHDAGDQVTQKDIELAAAIAKFNWTG